MKVISILRGINVGGNRKVPMVELKALYEELKFKNIVTYIQSGNVIFEANGSDLKDLPKKIEQKIFSKYKFTVPVIIRTAAEMQSVINKNPFLKQKCIDVDKLHVTFLAEAPNGDNLNKIKGLSYEPDKYAIVSKEVYLYCPNGYGNTKLNNNFFENKLKVTATTRNWRTVNELLKIAGL